METAASRSADGQIVKKIVSHAFEYMNATVTRCWSRWNDGSITYTDNKTTEHLMKDGYTYFGSTIVGLGDAPSATDGLNWIDTSKILGVTPPNG